MSLCNVASHWLKSGYMLQNMFALSVMYFTLKDNNVKYIRMGITVSKIIIWRAKLSVLWSRIAF